MLLEAKEMLPRLPLSGIEMLYLGQTRMGVMEQIPNFMYALKSLP